MKDEWPIVWTGCLLYPTPEGYVDPDMPLFALGLSNRALNILEYEGGMTTIAELLKKRAGDLLGYRNLGWGTLRHIREMLAMRHLYLQDE